ncbi:MAG: 3-oxoacyl-ACP reductase, partial [Spirochaetia bacterium]
MKIDSIGVRIPTRVITNDDVLKMLAQYSPEASVLLVKTYQRIVRGLFSAAGSQTRHIRDEEKGEKASTFITGAINDALEKASMKPEDIDLLIYCGVGKGFLEPANAYFYAQKLGMHASCFDIVDACMSWIRALEIS